MLFKLFIVLNTYTLFGNFQSSNGKPGEPMSLHDTTNDKVSLLLKY